jgi:lipopolysaccharide/colanic/teichoic acid biosynthesis glycosyltransferase
MAAPATRLQIPENGSVFQRAAKRGFDLVVAAGGLLACAAPMLLVAAVIKSTSRGPVFFLQERVGLRGRRFRILKFRTMVVDAPRLGPRITAAGDPRVTPIGALLRKTKFDEVPQLVNVVLGDMSLVGPRPEVADYVEIYPVEYREILSVRPGLTDPASIRFRDEEAVLSRYADREKAYREVLLPLKLDLARRYIRERTFWGDLAILGKTLVAIVRRSAASPDL